MTIEAAGAAPAALPDTPLGRAAAEYLAAVGSGDAARVERFLEERVSAWGLGHLPREEFARQCMRLHAQAGELTVLEVDGGEGHISLLARAARTGQPVQIFMGASGDEPGRIDGVGIMPRRAPQPGDEGEWPQGPLGEGEAMEAVGRAVARRAEEGRFSGVVLVARGGETLLHTAVGLAERSFGAPNRPDTKFNLGSMPKMFTAVAVAQLEAEGRLSYEDTVGALLPGYPATAARAATVRQLLTHSAGLRGLFDQPRYDRRTRYRSSAAILPVFADQEPLFAPGAGVSYSNEGYIVLGAILERLAGRSYQELVEERIFRPLGMRDSGCFALDEATPNLAVGYMRDDVEDPLGLEPRRPNHMFLGWRGNACGGGYATAPDMLRFAEGLRAGALLDPARVEQVTSPKVGLGPHMGYGFGFISQRFAGREARGHSGGGPSSGINGDLEIFWDGSYTVVVLGNEDAPAAQELSAEICTFLARQ